MLFKKDKEPDLLQMAIDEALLEMQKYESDDERYKEKLNSVERLFELQKAAKPKKSVSPDTVVGSLTNLLGIGMILGHEKMHVITTKAISFVSKPKL